MSPNVKLVKRKLTRSGLHLRFFHFCSALNSIMRHIFFIHSPIPHKEKLLQVSDGMFLSITPESFDD